MLDQIPKKMCSLIPEKNEVGQKLDLIKHDAVVISFKEGYEIKQVINSEGEPCVYVLLHEEENEEALTNVDSQLVISRYSQELVELHAEIFDDTDTYFTFNLIFHHNEINHLYMLRWIAKYGFLKTVFIKGCNDESFQIVGQQQLYVPKYFRIQMVHYIQKGMLFRGLKKDGHCTLDGVKDLLSSSGWSYQFDMDILGEEIGADIAIEYVYSVLLDLLNDLKNDDRFNSLNFLCWHCEKDLMGSRDLSVPGYILMITPMYDNEIYIPEHGQDVFATELQKIPGYIRQEGCHPLNEKAQPTIFFDNGSIYQVDLIDQDTSEELQKIQRLCSNESIDELDNALKDYEKLTWKEIDSATHFILKTFEEKSEPFFLKALNSNRYVTQSGAIKALGLLQSKEAITPISKFLEKQSKQTILAQIALANIGEESLNRLRRILREKNAVSRENAIKTLGMIGTKKSLAIIEKFKEDKSKKVREAVNFSNTGLDYPDLANVDLRDYS
ncbi:HEAT repeat domain-containing protein [Natranaerobius trueperi]|uniref:HEAT repeat domain-containing protein n=1 Tax=Natranaerobius trueperi TaxID=759412 RepID=A0A226C0I3_9FIRM|nr:HEAT repeat domain-containing protein [Natranaerobius trueperi]OWZ84104.1 hypothetical protein CDO51_05155 [Natranaerobius trueperi]